MASAPSSSKSSKTSKKPPKCDAPPAPEPEPPHGTDSEAYRTWAAEHATDKEFAALYATRKAKILLHAPRPHRPTEAEDHPFMLRLLNL